MKIALNLYKKGELTLEEMQLLIPIEMLENGIEHSNLNNSFSKEARFRLRKKNLNYFEKNSSGLDEEQDYNSSTCAISSTSPEKLLKSGKCDKDELAEDSEARTSKQLENFKAFLSDLSKGSGELQSTDELKKRHKSFLAHNNSFAERSVPDGLELRKSNLSTASVGVFTTRPFKKDTIFGPFIGEIDYELELPRGGNEWEIFVDDVKHHCVVGRNVNRSNWMMFVNVPLKVEDTNLDAFQKRYSVYYRANQDIPANKELYVFYCLDYDQDYTSQDDGDKVQKKFIKTEKAWDDKEFEKKDERRDNRIDLTKETSSEDANKCKCQFCGKISACKYSHELHLKKLHSNENKRRYKCDTCGKMFIKKFSLIRHIRTHTGEKPYKCDECNKSFNNSENLTRHVRTHTGEQPYTCTVCGKAFSQRCSLHCHMKMHTGEKPYECGICGLSFARSTNLNSHMKTHQICTIQDENETIKATDEKEFDKEKETGVTEKNSSGDIFDANKYMCQFCGKIFNCKYSHELHLEKIHHNDEKKQFKCDTCGKLFITKSHLLKHLSTHTGEKLYACNECDKSFNNNDYLTSHMKIHSGKQPYACKVCDKTFLESANLTKHARTHSGEKPFECGICNKAFSDSGNLARHMMTHSGQKPYKCDICSYSFSRRHHLNRHLKTHLNKITN